MNQLQKYTWLIETIRRAGKISFSDLSDRWERNKDLSDSRPLHRATFNHWRDAIWDQFGIIISCERKGGYNYFIENPEEIDEDRLKKWMLDSFAVSNVIGENLSLKDRILVDEIPSGRRHLTSILEAMKQSRVIDIAYHAFSSPRAFTFPIEPYCVKLFENRWYVMGFTQRNASIRAYALDRIETVSLTDRRFSLPDRFSAREHFADYYGIVTGYDVTAEQIVIRANADHKHYLKSLPLHHSQQLLEECDEYADFELRVAPTYDFVMKLLQAGPRIEVLHPASLRREMKQLIDEMRKLYD